jgi:hypothetical protein
MKAKPIVPGCKCIILPNKGQLFIGHIVTAITRMPPGTFDRNGHDVSGHWLTDLPPIREIKNWVVREQYLMRIDDPDNQAYIESTDKLERNSQERRKNVADS